MYFPHKTLKISFLDTQRLLVVIFLSGRRFKKSAFRSKLFENELETRRALKVNVGSPQIKGEKPTHLQRCTWARHNVEHSNSEDIYRVQMAIRRCSFMAISKALPRMMRVKLKAEAKYQNEKKNSIRQKMDNTKISSFLNIYENPNYKP